jgi:hypothetical protein
LLWSGHPQSTLSPRDATTSGSSSSTSSSVGLSLIEVSTFIAEQRRHDEQTRAELEEKLQRQRERLEGRMETQLAEMQAKLDEALAINAGKRGEGQQQQQQQQQQRRQQEEEEAVAVSDAQLEALQLRLEALLTAGALTDEEGAALFERLGDFIELSAESAKVLSVELVHTQPLVAFARKLSVLCERMSSDAALARQAVRLLSKQ